MTRVTERASWGCLGLLVRACEVVLAVEGRTIPLGLLEVQCGDGQESTSMMAASAALRLMDAIPFSTPAFVL